MLVVLTAVLALLDAWIGLACQGVIRVLGLLGAVLILAALAVAGRSRRVATVLLLAGALPLPIVTWWSLVSPAVAVLCLAFGIPAVRRAPARPTVLGRPWRTGLVRR